MGDEGGWGGLGEEGGGQGVSGGGLGDGGFGLNWEGFDFGLLFGGDVFEFSCSRVWPKSKLRYCILKRLINLKTFYCILLHSFWSHRVRYFYFNRSCNLRGINNFLSWHLLLRCYILRLQLRYFVLLQKKWIFWFWHQSASYIFHLFLLFVFRLLLIWQSIQSFLCNNEIGLFQYRISIGYIGWH